MRNYITRKSHNEIFLMVADVRRKMALQGEKLAEALEVGGDGTHDNSSYESARNEQILMAETERELSGYLLNPVFIDDLNIDTDVVGLGTEVMLINTENGMERSLIILGAGDVVVSKSGPIVSVESPIAKRIIGKNIGEVIRIGEHEFSIKLINSAV